MKKLAIVLGSVLALTGVAMASNTILVMNGTDCTMNYQLTPASMTCQYFQTTSLSGTLSPGGETTASFGGAYNIASISPVTADGIMDFTATVSSDSIPLTATSNMLQINDIAQYKAGGSLQSEAVSTINSMDNTVSTAPTSNNLWIMGGGTSWDMKRYTGPDLRPAVDVGTKVTVLVTGTTQYIK